MDKSRLHIAIVHFAVLISIIFFSCSTDDENPTEPEEPIDIVGTWNLTKLTIITPTDTSVKMPDEFAMTRIFNSDRTYAHIEVFNQDSTSTYSGTWSKEGKTITVIRHQNIPFIVLTVMTFEENSMTLSESYSSSRTEVSDWIKE